MNRKGLKAFLLVIGVLVSACSTQWRDASLDVSSDDVASMLAEAQGTSGQSTTSTSMFPYSAQAVVYFGNAPSSLGPVPSFLSLMDFSFLGAGQDIWYGNVQQARVFFLDYSHDSSDDVELIFGLDTGSGFSYYTFTGQGGVDRGLFDATLTGPNGQEIIVESYDVTDDVLADTIQLKVYAVGAGGDASYVGKISTLVGYGQ